MMDNETGRAVYMAKYRREHKEEKAAYLAKWRKKNPEYQTKWRN